MHVRMCLCVCVRVRACVCVCVCARSGVDLVSADVVLSQASTAGVQALFLGKPSVYCLPPPQCYEDAGTAGTPVSPHLHACLLAPATAMCCVPLTARPPPPTSLLRPSPSLVS